MPENRENKHYPPGFPWVNQFRRLSWWFSPAKKRTFLITYVYYQEDGQVRLIELLELGKELAKPVTSEQMIEWFENGQMKPISNMPDTVHI